MTCTRFAAMIATSILVMFFLMYLNIYALDHTTFSGTRVYMALLMEAVLAVVMLSYMLSMYMNRTANMAIFVGSLWLVHSQATVGDGSHMRAMIAHVSIAIMTSRRVNIKDPRVRELADGIIAAQVREIDEINTLIADLTGAPAPE